MENLKRAAAEKAETLQQIESLQQMLNHCLQQHEAKITIAIDHSDGSSVTAQLYDHAAFVQPLIDALDEFKAEL